MTRTRRRIRQSRFSVSSPASLQQFPEQALAIFYTRPDLNESMSSSLDAFLQQAACGGWLKNPRLPPRSPSLLEVVIEGLNGSGQSTLVKNPAAAL